MCATLSVNCCIYSAAAGYGEMPGPGYPHGMRPPQPQIPGVHPPGIHPPDVGQVPSNPADMKPNQEALLHELKEKIKEKAKQLGYAPCQNSQEGATPAQQGHPQDPATGTTAADVSKVKKSVDSKAGIGGPKPSVSSEEEKTDDTDELADFFSKSNIVQAMEVVKRFKLS